MYRLIPDQIATDTSACNALVRFPDPLADGSQAGTLSSNAHTREVTSIPLITDHKGRVNCIYKEILFDNKKHFPQIRI